MGGAEVGQAFIVGAQRSGTTSLATALEANPQVALAQPRRPEPKVFLSPTGIDVDEYVARFYADAGPDTLLRLEKSTSYLESEVACAEIARVFPEAHVVVLLRDPVERAVSHHAFSRAEGLEHLPLDEALDPSAESRPWDTEAVSVSPFRYLSRGRYVDDLRRWFDRFASMHVLLLEDLLAEPERFTELERSLGLAPGAGFVVEERHNAGEGAEALDDGTRARLAAWYADANADLADLLGRPITRWTHA
jgi:Sulfotransferase domain